MHGLPLRELSPKQFEQLCFDLLRMEGHEDVEHVGGSGDRGLDLLSTKDGRTVGTQCKRVDRFGPKAAGQAISEVRAHAANDNVEQLVICVSAAVSRRTRDAARRLWKDCEFWCETRLNALLHARPSLMRVWFGAQDASDPRIARLSDMQRQSAGIVERRSEVLGDVLLQDLYVERDVEARLVRALMDSEPGTAHAIVGEPGTGKTSLLWHVARTLEARGRAVRFANAAILRGATSLLGVGMAELVRAAEEVGARGERCVVILDTADVLAHDESFRLAFQEGLTTLAEAEAVALVATRPFEAATLLTRDVRRHPLGPYTTSEVERAVRTHVEAYSPQAPWRERQDRIDRILSAASTGRSLATVCSHPLTMRMLFSVYSPEEVPHDIHVAQLHQQYWLNRVAADVRPGQSVPSSTDDLSETAMAVGLAMLEAGTPELPAAVLEAAVRRRRARPGHVEALMRRGVLRRTPGLDAIGFFHQTFGEHAAARAMLSTLSRGGSTQGGISLLLERTRDRPHDLLPMAVLEQALLLGGASTEVRQALLDLLARDRLESRAVALRVVARGPDEAVSLAERTRAVLLGVDAADPALVIKFLDAAHDVPDARRGWLLDLLSELWARHGSMVRERILGLLERLAFAAPDAVLAFADARRITEMLLDRLPDRDPEMRLIGLASAIARQYPDRAWELLSEGQRRSRRRGKGKAIETNIVAAIADLAPLLGVDRIASRLLADASLSARGDVPGDWAEAWGRLHELEWRAAGYSWPEVVRQALAVTGKAEIAVAAAGCAAWLLRDGTAGDLAVAWADVAKADRAVRHAFTRYCWSAILRKAAAMDSTLRDVPSVASSVRSRLADALELLAVSSTPRDERRHGLEILGLMEALPLAAIRTQFEDVCMRVHGEEPWLDPDRWGPWIGLAYLSGHDGARRAVTLVDEAVDRSVRDALSSSIAGSIDDQESARVLVRLALMADDTTRLIRALNATPLVVHQALAATGRSFDELIERTRSSPSGEVRRSAYQLWAVARSRGLGPPIAWRTVRDGMSIEADVQARTWMVELVGLARADGDDEVRLGFLVGHCRSTRRAMERDRAFQALCRMLEAGGRGRDAYEAVLALAEERELNPKLVAGFAWTLEPLVERDVDGALSLVERILLGPSFTRLGRSARNTMVNRLKHPLRLVLHEMTPRQRARILALIASVEDDFAARRIAGLAADEWQADDEALHALLESSSLPSSARLHLAQRRRPGAASSAAWPELAGWT